MNFFLIFILLITSKVWAARPTGAVGTEVGVARLSDGKKSAVGPSWVFHSEYQVDPIFGIFVRAGRSDAKDGSKSFNQTIFNGGIQLDVLPVLEFRIGVASTILEIKDSESTKRENELGPMAGATAFVPIDVWKIGASATFIRTGSLNSTALRLVALLVF
jgi:hypothetical protein